MADHTLKIVVNRTMETGKWVAEVMVDKERRQTILVFSQREDKFAPLQWLQDWLQHRYSATTLAKKYLQALNFHPDQAFGSKSGFLHIRKGVSQSAIDRKFSEASKTLLTKPSASGPVSAPFAASTRNFSSIKVAFNDSFEHGRARDAAISAILDEVMAVDQSMTRGSRDRYYQPLLKLAYDVSKGATDTAPESELRSALGVLKNFREKLTSPGEPESTSLQLVEDMLSRIDKLLYPDQKETARPVEVQLSSPEVYGKRPDRPEGLGTGKNKTPGR